jgi:hypothetical protein
MRGEDDPPETRGNLDHGGHAGATIMPAFKIFHCQEYYLNLLKCMYSHCICLPETGIMLFVNQRGYVHSEPPIVICTVVVVVDIAARQQRF